MVRIEYRQGCVMSITQSHAYLAMCLTLTNVNIIFNLFARVAGFFAI